MKNLVLFFAISASLRIQGPSLPVDATTFSSVCDLLRTCTNPLLRRLLFRQYRKIRLNQHMKAFLTR